VHVFIAPFQKFSKIERSINVWILGTQSLWKIPVHLSGEGRGCSTHVIREPLILEGWEKPAWAGHTSEGFSQCCGSGIWCLVDPWIWDPEWVFSGSWIRILDTNITSESLRSIILGVKVIQFCADFLKYFSVHLGVGCTHESLTHEGRIHEGCTYEGRIHEGLFTKVLVTKVVFMKDVLTTVVLTTVLLTTVVLTKVVPSNALTSTPFLH